MAESILFGIAENLLGKLASSAVQEIGLALGIKKDLNKLSRTLTIIKVVLLDAESKQEANPKLRIWMEGLKDVCSSAENVLDEFAILALRRRVMQGSTLTKKVRNFFSSSNPIVFNFKMGHKIKEIRLALDVIAKEKDDYNLSQQTLDRKVPHVWRETHSRVDSGDVVGRDRDEKVIIDHLLRVDDGKCVSVIPIVGIGGLGKTTLAKSVFNDLRVIEHFKFRKWVCVSEDFDVKKIISNIVECEESSTLEYMKEHLEQSLRDNRYLLVLDDVWNEEASKWERLSSLLMCGANGSKIVVTTRSSKVASITHPTYTHPLKGLSDEDSLDLLMKHAFEDGQEKKYPYLEEFGKDIAKKCRGVPLAIRTLGSHLNMKTEVSEWLNVRDSEVWSLEQGESDILPVLKLSYDALPPYLKQCFAVCSMFEKDHEYSGVSVIYLWMALGLLKRSQNIKEEERGQNLEEEEVGKKYLIGLLSRSFFQDYREFDYEDRFKMHDLMHDLAISVTKSDCARLSHDSPNDVFVHPKVRHVSFDNKILLSGDAFSNFVPVANDLRMIRVGCDIDVYGSNQYFLNTCISKFKFLRVLDLKRSRFMVLPNSIGGLKHLRYLDVSIGMKLLPNSLCKLLSLQYLELKNSGPEGFERLPENLRDLINLRYLKVGTNESRFRIQGIGSLTSLRTLIVERCNSMEHLFDDNDYDRVGGMQQNLPNLRMLVINSCPKLVSLPRSLKYLTRLKTLEIANCEELDLMKDNNIEEVGSLVSLQVLVINDLPKLVAFPPWLPQGGVASTCLKKLVIRRCSHLKKFPENLRYLQKLIIEKCPRLTSFFEGSNPLPRTLEELVILGCPVLGTRYKSKLRGERHMISHIRKVIITTSEEDALEDAVDTLRRLLMCGTTEGDAVSTLRRLLTTAGGDFLMELENLLMFLSRCGTTENALEELLNGLLILLTRRSRHEHPLGRLLMLSSHGTKVGAVDMLMGEVRGEAGDGKLRVLNFLFNVLNDLYLQMCGTTKDALEDAVDTMRRLLMCGTTEGDAVDTLRRRLLTTKVELEHLLMFLSRGGTTENALQELLNRLLMLLMRVDMVGAVVLLSRGTIVGAVDMLMGEVRGEAGDGKLRVLNFLFNVLKDLYLQMEETRIGAFSPRGFGDTPDVRGKFPRPRWC